MTDKTITRGKLTELAGGGLTAAQMDNIAAYFGYRIIDDAPPEGVVKLAREIADRVAGYCDPAEQHPCEKVAIAVIMHARKAVEDARDVSHIVGGVEHPLPGCARSSDILRKLGGEG